MVGVKPVGSDPDFQPELSGAGSRLAVVKFTMRGCGPCLRIAPAFSSMSNKYPQAVFLEVDVHQCQGTAATNNISATPTFLFFRNKVRIDQYQGADAVGLEEKIKQHLENDPGSNEDTDIPKGYMDLMPFINKAGCECLNESDEHGFDNCLRKDLSFLESDCDEQLLITVAFNQPVKLYSMKFQGPDNGQGPKYVKIFINLPRSMDFEEAERSEPTQALELTEDDIKEDGIVPLRYVKFQNVNSVTLFVQSNQGEEETTRISYFTFIGTPVQATNMNDFKRLLATVHPLSQVGSPFSSVAFIPYSSCSALQPGRGQVSPWILTGPLILLLFLSYLCRLSRRMFEWVSDILVLRLFLPSLPVSPHAEVQELWKPLGLAPCDPLISALCLVLFFCDGFHFLYGKDLMREYILAS